MTRRVRLAETDSSGFAHFSTYVRLMEETEYSFLRSKGLCVVLHDERGTIGFPRISVEIQVYEPATYGENLLVLLQMTECDGKQIAYHFEVVNDASQLVASGDFRVATCRFPASDAPYAILTPEFVMKALGAYP